MGLSVVGAGLPRTGTTSLTAALEQLTGERCYHMTELFPNVATHGPLLAKAMGGEVSTLDEVFADYGSAVDWPASLFWRELAEANPEALVVMSHRASADAWWKSVDRTVWYSMRHGTEMPEWDAFTDAMRAKAGLGDDWDDPDVAKAHYQALIDEVTATIEPERLLTWQPGDGWEPLCTALGVAVPDEPFPHRNTTAEYRSMSGWD
jgi:hypothetical protein